MNSAIFDIGNSDSEWKSISVHDKKHLIRSIEFDGGWIISLTDLVELWTERLDRPTILRKCEELNPSLSIEDIDIYEFVRRLLADVPKHATEVSAARIELSSELEGGIFYFAIDLARGTAQQLWKEVTMPMCLAAGELLRRHNILMELVKAKDEEILEYKLNGAELIRKHIETAPLCNDFFEKNVPTPNIDSCQAAFQAIVKLSGVVKKERFSIKMEHVEKCSAKENDTRAASVIIEAAEKPTLTDIDLPGGGGGPSKFEGKSTSVVQGSNTIVPKAEPNDSPELIKPSRASIEIHKDARESPKRARTIRSSPVKRPKKTIHDFIS